MRKILAGIMLAVAMTAAPAMAQETVTFSVGVVNYIAPMPKGYCEPQTAGQIANARYVASLDKENVTALTLVSCGPNADPMDYLIIKSPVALLRTPVKLTDVTGSPEFAKAEAPGSLPDVEGTLNNALSDKLGQDVTVKTSVSLLGHDNLCGYMGGTIEANVDNQHFISLGGCMTALGERTYTVFYYAPGNAPGTVKVLLTKARAFVLTVKVRK